MNLSRRDILTTGLIAATGSTLKSGKSFADMMFSPEPGAWRTYDVTTRLEIPTHGGPAQAWIPVPSVDEATWVKLGGNTVISNGIYHDWQAPDSGARLIHAIWPGAGPTAIVEVTSRVSLQNRAAALPRPAGPYELSSDDLRRYTASNDHIRLDSLVKQTSDSIVAATDSAGSPLEKVRAIYEWMVENTYREASVRGCGTGDIVSMLKTGKLGGKCADLNALFVGLVRAQGIPARDIYGIRVAASAFGFKSLGANSSDITKAQHCRSEVFLTEFGWVPIDPADVRKVALEEPPGALSLDSPAVRAARTTLFGSWEGNWMPYNVADLIALPQAKAGKPSFVMYPEVETVAGRLDCLDPQSVAYTITSKRIV